MTLTEEEKQSRRELRERMAVLYEKAMHIPMGKEEVITGLLGKCRQAFKQTDYAHSADQLAEMHNKAHRYLLCAYRTRNERNGDMIYKEAQKLVRRLAQKDYEFLQNKNDLEAFVAALGKRPSLCYKSTSITDKYDAWTKDLLKQEILDRVQTDPVVEFEEARTMTRHFHLHIGPTNSGKTYDAIQQLKKAENGVYLGPLRLLALEIYDTMTEAGVLCSMLTGEEHIDIPFSTVISQTIETVDLDVHYDIAVIDECQMLTDESRGYAWSRALLGLLADEIYLCASENALNILIDIIEKCGDTYDVTRHERKTSLRLEEECLPVEEDLSVVNRIKPGDCFILFSKRAVLDMAARLEMMGLRVSVIYGKLPPENRKREVYRFTNHETDVVVATDAIGMGINLPIRRVIFAATRKFDGRDIRRLNADEVLQIAGRAGRYGLYDEGLVTATTEEGLEIIRECMTKPLTPITKAILYFPRILLEIDKPVDEIMRVWSEIPATKPYQKMDISEMQILYTTLERNTKHFKRLPDGDDKYAIYDMISCPIDVKNRTVIAQWIRYCETYAADVRLAFPEHRRGMSERGELDDLEDYYKVLDLYHIFSLRMGKFIEEERLAEQKRRTEMKIEEILVRNKNSFAAKCPFCGKMLPMGTARKMCEECEEELNEFRRGPERRPGSEPVHHEHHSGRRHRSGRK